MEGKDQREGEQPQEERQPEKENGQGGKPSNKNGGFFSKQFFIGVLATIFVAMVIWSVSTYVSKTGEKRVPAHEKGAVAEKIQTAGEEERQVEIKNIAPSDEDGSFRVKSVLQLTFSDDIVLDEQVGKEASKGSIKIEPQADIKTVWRAKNMLEISPATQFTAGREYQITVNQQIVSQPKTHIIGALTRSFVPAVFEVQDCHTRAEFKADSSAKLEITLLLSYYVSKEELEKNLVIKTGNKENEKSISYEIAERDPSVSFKITTDYISVEKQLLVSVNKGLTSSDGSSKLGNDFEQRFSYAELKANYYPDLKASSARAVGGEDGYSIDLGFSHKVEPKKARPFLEVKPRVDFRIESGGSDHLMLIGDFLPNTNYKITIKEGLRGEKSAPLPKQAAFNVKTGDLNPILRFISEGSVLPVTGTANIGVKTVNIAEIGISVWKVYANNVVYFSRSDYQREDELGTPLTTERIKLNAVKNKKEISVFNLKELIADKNAKGIYVYRVSSYKTMTSSQRSEDEEGDYYEGYWVPSIRKWVVMTDLGLYAKQSEDEISVFVNSLSTLASQQNVKVSLFSSSNQEMATAVTDVNGVANFKGIKAQRKEFQPLIVVAEKGNDFSFVNLERNDVSLADFGVSGLSLEGKSYTAYPYKDRGVYRPGETVHITFIVRDVNGAIPASFPYAIEVRAPEGRRFKTLQGTLAEGGLATVDIDLPTYAVTGSYNVTLMVAGKVWLASTSFQVEEFIPDKIKVEVKPEKEVYEIGESATINVKGTMLFGPPAAGRSVSGKATLVLKAIAPKSYQGYSFANENKSNSYKKIEIALGETALSDTGEAKFTVKLGEAGDYPSALAGSIEVTVSEPASGRSVTGRTSVAVNPYKNYVGIKRITGEVEPQKPVAFSLVVLDTEEKPVTGKKLIVEMQKEVWHSLYQRDEYGRMRWVSEKSYESVGSKEVISENEPVKVEFTPSWGRHVVIVKDETGGASATTDFESWGWYDEGGYQPWQMEKPAYLNVTLNKEDGRYKTGEKAVAQIRAPFGGKLIVTVERDKIFEYRFVEMKNNTAEVEFTVKPDWKPNVYITAAVIRSTAGIDTASPMRAIGTAPLLIDVSESKMPLTINVPEKMKPNSELLVSISGGKNAGGGYVTVSAVDEGILQLTNFKTPDPFEYFLQKRRLDTTTADFYALLIPDLVKKQSHIGGGDESGAEGFGMKNLAPVAVTRVKTVSLWSGVVKLDKQGNAQVKFQVPQFNGTLRVMAVSASNAVYGSAEKSIIVSDPVTATVSLPRFLAGGDSFSIPVSIYNNTGSDGNFTATITVSGPIKLKEAKKSAEIKNGRETALFFDAQAKMAVGKAEFQFAVSGNNQKTEETIELAIRPANQFSIRTVNGSVLAGKKATIPLADDYIPETLHAQFAVSPLPVLKIGKSFSYLLHYPYGCVEQTSSTLFALLYFSDVSKLTASDKFEKQSPEYFVNAGIQKLESMQLSDGGFSFWPGGDYENEWGSIYASHLLVEAKKAGYSVTPAVFDGIETNLSNIASNSRGNFASRAYALYVLSLMGKPDIGTMFYLKENINKKVRIDERTQLASALVIAGRQAAAKEIMPAKFEPVTVAQREDEGYFYFDSSTRANAILTAALVEVDPNHPALEKLKNALIEGIENAEYWSTQEVGFAGFALGKYFRAKKEEANFTGTISLDGKQLAKFDSAGTSVTDPKLAGGTVALDVDGRGNCYYFAKMEGIKQKGADEELDTDLSIRRTIMDKNGNAVSLNSIKQGELYVVKAVLKSKRSLREIAVVDMLPAGLEIENPRLATSASLPAGLKSDAIREPNYMDIRDDRIMVFFNYLEKNKPLEFLYAVRAVTVGDFALPVIKAEAMYDPEVRSLNGAGRIKVVSSAK